MLQLHDLVRAQSTVTEILQKFPETEAVFQKFKMRVSCYECPIQWAAQKSGIELDALLVEVNEAIYRNRGITN
jgi:iron-sulfur cluster repair protein YtfE (RIC family)